MRRLDVEIVVVGAGVMGLATARELARAGRAVALVEQFRVGHARGSSHGRSRIFRLSYPDARWVRLAQEAVPLWGELEAEAGETLIERYGSLDLGDWRPNRECARRDGDRVRDPRRERDRAALSTGRRHRRDRALPGRRGNRPRRRGARRAARLGCGGRGSGARGDARRGARAGRDRRDGFRRRRLDPGRRGRRHGRLLGAGSARAAWDRARRDLDARDGLLLLARARRAGAVADRLRRRGWSGTARLRARRARASD